MVLSDRDIKKALKSGLLTITPGITEAEQLGSCSIDFRLGNRFRVFEHSKYPYIDPTKKDYSNEITREVVLKDGEAFIMQPGDFALAVTMERIKIHPSLLGRLEGRSSLGRLGIIVHSTASVFEPGWDGQAVLELGNMGRLAVALYPGMRICAMTFEQLSSEAQTPYTKKVTAKYINQTGPDESKIHSDSD